MNCRYRILARIEIIATKPERNTVLCTALRWSLPARVRFGLTAILLRSSFLVFLATDLRNGSLKQTYTTSFATFGVASGGVR